MDSVIKNRGIYSSYISEMRALRSLTVKLEPRLVNTWKTFTNYHCRWNELFSPDIPLTLTRFECPISRVDWEGMSPAEQRIVVFSWLDKFPDISIGTMLKKIIFM